jgi:hypothetical protein
MIGSSFSAPKLSSWFDVVSRIGETVPPFACIDLTGILQQTIGGEDLGSDRGESDLYTIECGKTDSPADEGGIYAFNGPIPILDDGAGRATMNNIFSALYNGTPNYGDVLGPKAGEWYLDATGLGGFRFVGAISEDDDGNKVGVFERVWNDLVEDTTVTINSPTAIDLSYSGATEIKVELFLTPYTFSINVAGDVVGVVAGSSTSISDTLSGTACP